MEDCLFFKFYVEHFSWLLNCMNPNVLFSNITLNPILGLFKSVLMMPFLLATFCLPFLICIRAFVWICTVITDSMPD